MKIISWLSRYKDECFIVISENLVLHLCIDAREKITHYGLHGWIGEDWVYARGIEFDLLSEKWIKK